MLLETTGAPTTCPCPGRSTGSSRPGSTRLPPRRSDCCRSPPSRQGVGVDRSSRWRGVGVSIEAHCTVCQRSRPTDPSKISLPTKRSTPSHTHSGVIGWTDPASDRAEKHLAVAQRHRAAVADRQGHRARACSRTIVASALDLTAASGDDSDELRERAATGWDAGGRSAYLLNALPAAVYEAALRRARSTTMTGLAPAPLRQAGR